MGTSALLNARISQTVERIRRALGFSAAQYCEMLGMSAEDYKKIILHRSEFKLTHLVTLSSALDLNLNLLFSGDVDLTSLAAHYHGAKSLLPEKYTDPGQQLARVRTVQGVITFLENTAGTHYVDHVLGRLQIKASCFGHPDDFTSPLLIQDLLCELQSDRFEDFQVRDMGVASLWVNQKAEMGRHFSKMKSQNELYRSSCEELIGNFDRVWNYRLLTLRNSFCVIEVRPKDETLDIFRSSIIGTREVCLCRQGVIQSFPGFLGQDIAKITEQECMYEGSSRCVYHVDWSHLPKIAARRPDQFSRTHSEQSRVIRLNCGGADNKLEHTSSILLHA